MTIDIPGPLRWVSYLAGQEWPDGDEDAMRRLGDDWKTSSNELKDLIPELNRVKSEIRASFTGKSANAVDKTFKDWFEGDYALDKMASAMDGLAGLADGHATNLQYTKLMILTTLALAAGEIAIALAGSPFTTGAIPGIEAVTTAAIRKLAAQLLKDIIEKLAEAGAKTAIKQLLKEFGEKVMTQVGKELLEEAGERVTSQAAKQLGKQALKQTAKGIAKDVAKDVAKETALSTAQEAGIQAYQVANGWRDKMDWKQVGLTAGSSAVGALAGQPTAFGVSRLTSKMGLGKVTSGMLSGYTAGVAGNAAGTAAVGGDLNATSIFGGASTGALSGGVHGALDHGGGGAGVDGDHGSTGESHNGTPAAADTSAQSHQQEGAQQNGAQQNVAQPPGENGSQAGTSDTATTHSTPDIRDTAATNDPATTQNPAQQAAPQQNAAQQTEQTAGTQTNTPSAPPSPQAGPASPANTNAASAASPTNPSAASAATYQTGTGAPTNTAPQSAQPPGTPTTHRADSAVAPIGKAPEGTQPGQQVAAGPVSTQSRTDTSSSADTAQNSADAAARNDNQARQDPRSTQPGPQQRIGQTPDGPAPGKGTADSDRSNALGPQDRPDQQGHRTEPESNPGHKPTGEETQGIVDDLQHHRTQPDDGATPESTRNAHDEAQAVHEKWENLTPDEQKAVIDRETQPNHKTDLGDLDGLPAHVRDTLNRHNLVEDMVSRYPEHEHAIREHADALNKHLADPDNHSRPRHFDPTGDRPSLLNRVASLFNDSAPFKNVDATWRATYGAPDTPNTPPRQLLTYDPKAFGGDGRIAVSIGNLDRAGVVSVHTPGITSTIRSIEGNITNAENHHIRSNQQRPDQANAVIAWIGYDAPSGLGLARTPSQRLARLGGNRLAHDIAALAGTVGDDTRINMFGHSYGSTTTAHAGAHGRLASYVDTVTLLGSPGAGPLRHANDFSDGVHRVEVYVAANSHDLVTGLGGIKAGHFSSITGRLHLGGLGMDPAMHSFGATRIAAEYASVHHTDGIITAHANYFSTELHNISGEATPLRINPHARPTESLANFTHISTGDTHRLTYDPPRASTDFYDEARIRPADPPTGYPGPTDCIPRALEAIGGTHTRPLTEDFGTAGVPRGAAEQAAGTRLHEAPPEAIPAATNRGEQVLAVVTYRPETVPEGHVGAHAVVIKPNPDDPNNPLVIENERASLWSEYDLSRVARIDIATFHADGTPTHPMTALERMSHWSRSALDEQRIGQRLPDDGDPAQSVRQRPAQMADVDQARRDMVERTMGPPDRFLNTPGNPDLSGDPRLRPAELPIPVDDRSLIIVDGPATAADGSIITRFDDGIQRVEYPGDRTITVYPDGARLTQWVPREVTAPDGSTVIRDESLLEYPGEPPRGVARTQIGENIARWDLEAGRTYHAQAIVRQDFGEGDRPSAENTAARAVGNQAGITRDDGGHMIAFRYLGDQGYRNLNPQDLNLNRGAFKRFENEVAHLIEVGADEVHVDVFGSGPDRLRPEQFLVQYETELDGEKVERSREFDNEKGQEFKRRFYDGGDD